MTATRVLTCRRYTDFGWKTFAWDCSTPEKRAAAYLAYFELMCDLGVYRRNAKHMMELQLFDAACAGNSQCAQAYIAMVDDGSYDLEVVDVIGSEREERRVVPAVMPEEPKQYATQVEWEEKHGKFGVDIKL